VTCITPRDRIVSTVLTRSPFLIEFLLILLFDSEDGSSQFLRNVYILLLVYTLLHLRNLLLFAGEQRKECSCLLIVKRVKPVACVLYSSEDDSNPGTLTQEFPLHILRETELNF
jgi:hypothetical protein